MSARILAEKILGGIMCLIYILLLFLFINIKSFPSGTEAVIFIISGILALTSVILYVVGYSQDENSDTAIALKWTGISLGYLLPFIIFFIYEFTKIPKFIKVDGKEQFNPEWCKKEVEKAQEKAARGEYQDGKKITICNTDYDFKPNEEWCTRQIALAQENAARGVYYDRQKIKICGTEYEFKRNN